MNVTVKQLGMAILSAIAIVLVVHLLIKENGIFSRLPGQFNENLSGYYDEWQADVFADILGTGSPVITLSDADSIEDQLTVGQAYDLPELFTATDAQGNTLTVKVIDVSSASGESLLYSCDADGTKHSLQDIAAFLFPTSGSYQITVTAVDSKWKQAQKVIWIAVQGVKE